MRRFNPSGPPADARYHYEVPRRELVERCVARLLGAPDEGGGVFTSRPALDEEKVQAARHAKELGATEAALCLFVPMSDETAVFKLSSIEVMEDMMVSTVAIGWG